MMFAERLREPVIRREVTCSVRIWHGPRVEVGGRCWLGAGVINVTALREIGLADAGPRPAVRAR